MTAVTLWHCSSCGQPVELRTAREHYDRCAAGDKPEPDDPDDDLDDDGTDTAA